MVHRSMFVITLAVGATSCLAAEPPTSRPAATQASQPVVPILFTPEQLKADLDFLFQTIEEVHPNIYAYVSRKDFSAQRHALYRQIDKPMAQIEFYKAVSPVIAQIRNGHTNVHPPFQAFQTHVSSNGKVFPLELQWDADRLLVARNYGPVYVPLAGQILRIAGEDASTAFRRITSRFASEARTSSPQLLENREFLLVLMWAEYGSPDSLTLTIRDGDDATKDYDVPFIPIQQLAMGWSLRKATSAQWSFRILPDQPVGILEMNTCKRSKDFETFLEKTFDEIREEQIQDLIIDIRNNPGGNDAACSLLMEYLSGKTEQLYARYQLMISPQLRKGQPGNITRAEQILGKSAEDGQLVTMWEDSQPAPSVEPNPKRFKGRAVLLISRKTGSAAVTLASSFKALHIGPIIGQETGDALSTYGDCLSFRMPNSQLPFVVACKYFLLYGGKPDGRGVLPDYEVCQKPEDTTRNIDTIMEYALRLLRRPPTCPASEPASQPAEAEH